MKTNSILRMLVNYARGNSSLNSLTGFNNTLVGVLSIHFSGIWHTWDIRVE